MDKKYESTQQRAEVAKRRAELGYKFTRHLTLDEGRKFLSDGLVPADALGKSTFVKAKRFETLPHGFSCLCCGVDLSGKPGWLVQTAESHLKTICPDDYDKIVSGGSEEEPDDDEAEQETAKPATPAAPTAAPVPDVATALKTLTEALATPKAPPLDEGKVLADAVKAAKDAAQSEAKSFMQKTLTDFLKDGTVPTAEAEDKSEPKLARAKGDGVEASAKASGWSARATAPAKDAVDKLNKFLSEFSYFRGGVSMRLVNTFARADDKKAALRAYCEVSQMEDLPDLIEKMKSAEFGEVVKAFDALKTPKPINRRFSVFYGNPGGGKTYAAIKAGEAINGGDCDVMPCSRAMDPSDMLYAYRLDYKTGKRGYVPTALLTAMVAGRAVVLDEINLLPMEARMFLQNILDNKSKVHIMGLEIPISDGFFVLATMNPETGEGVQPLPLPLVDRAAVVKEFRTSASQCAVGAGLC